MARVKLGFDEPPRPVGGALIDRLVEELHSGAESGQPFIYEQTFLTGKIKLLVVWDDWKDLPLEHRTRIILAAVERADGKEYRARVALASGLTVPEAAAAAMLPYQIITAIRKSDPVTFEQCRDAMLAEGASTIFGPEVLQLRFPTRDAAEASLKRLSENLPGSEDVWVINRDVTIHDYGQGHDGVEGEAY